MSDCTRRANLVVRRIGILFLQLLVGTTMTLAEPLSSAKMPALNCAAAAAQLVGKRTHEFAGNSAKSQEVLSRGARQLWNGTWPERISPRLLPSGHKLFGLCMLRGRRIVRHFVAPGLDMDKAAVSRLQTVLDRVWHGARVMGLDDVISQSLQRKGLGRWPALITIGPMPVGYSATYLKIGDTSLVAMNVKSWESKEDPVSVLLHEMVGHFLSRHFCSTQTDEACQHNLGTFVSRIVEEADAYTKQFAYVLYRQVIFGDEPGPHVLRSTSYAGVKYIHLARQILQHVSAENDAAVSGFSTSHQIPRKLLVGIFREFVVSPSAHHLIAFSMRGYLFGQDRDLRAMLKRVVFLNNREREELRILIRGAPWYVALRHRSRVTVESVKILLQEQQH